MPLEYAFKILGTPLIDTPLKYILNAWYIFKICIENAWYAFKLHIQNTWCVAFATGFYNLAYIQNRKENSVFLLYMSL